MTPASIEDRRQLEERYIPDGYDPDLYRVRHSSAHVMAQAVIERFGSEGEVHLGIGPPTRDGFYYDFALPRTITDEDLEWVEARMKEILRGKYVFECSELSAEEAKEMFATQPLKLELIDDLTRPASDDGEAEQLTIYQQDDFVDLCRGPHVEHTGKIHPKAIKVMGISGAYWRGDETRPQLQRIYGTAFLHSKELRAHLSRLAEAEKRDHRRLGKELELIHFEQSAPGMPYWLPNGLKVLNTLIDFWREEHEKRGYLEIASPLINEKSLWETSGHWSHYQENMFICPVSEHVTYGVKPMNCPNAMVVYNLKTRSYRDLPYRLSDCDILHRNERSGTLHGLLRVQSFRQDDAHIFVTEDQIEEEYNRILDICDLFYGVFGLEYRLRFGTRPEKFIGDVETWDKAEAALTRILDGRVGEGNYVVEHGDGAFYGPKVDILMADVLEREWQMGTIQLDFQLPRRFDCTYTDNDGEIKTPVVIHRVIYGSLERFVGILIEHTAGAFPTWIAPVQARVLTITDKQNDYGAGVVEQFRDAGLRAELDDRNERLGAKIREARLQRVPYMLVVGEKEAESDQVAVTLRGGKKLGALPVTEVIDRVRQAVDDKAAL